MPKSAAVQREKVVRIQRKGRCSVQPASAGGSAGQQCFETVTRQVADISVFENRRLPKSGCEAPVSCRKRGDDTGAEVDTFGGPLRRQCLPDRGDVGTDREMCISLPFPMPILSGPALSCLVLSCPVLPCSLFSHTCPPLPDGTASFGRNQGLVTAAHVST
jgi:hypothetical protein